LRTGARLVIPVGLPYRYQELMVVEKKANGEIETWKVLGVGFVPLTGEHEAKVTHKGHQNLRI
jgi:protein-L-isoaspartate(D-aspartate) O-methyltransferase